jgi:hypothetical protein
MSNVKPISLEWFLSLKTASLISRTDYLVDAINKAISKEGEKPNNDFGVVFEGNFNLDIGLRLIEIFESAGWRVELENTTSGMMSKLTLSKPVD